MMISVFTDGCTDPRSILADAGFTNLPILDGFHIAMRLRRAKQTSIGLATNGYRAQKCTLARPKRWQTPTIR